MNKYSKVLLTAVFVLFGYSHQAFSQDIGLASWYGPGLQENTTAGGELFDMNELTAAHPTLPFDTQVKVTNLKNKKSVVVRINDRGPFIHNRIIDVSREAARRLEILHSGVARVKVEVVDGEIAENPQFSKSSGSIPIENTEIPPETMILVHNKAFPIYRMKRDFPNVTLKKGPESRNSKLINESSL